MSGLWMLLAVIGLVVSIIRRIRQDNRRMRQSQPPSQPLPPKQQPKSLPKEQSAYEWIFGKPSAPPTHTEGGSDEDWIRPVESTLHSDLQEIQETPHEVVHESVHESLHVRRQRQQEERAEASPHPLQLNAQTLKQALLLKEVLDTPRSKNPWQPSKR
jgi:hypothetical protein